MSSQGPPAAASSGGAVASRSLDGLGAGGAWGRTEEPAMREAGEGAGSAAGALPTSGEGSVGWAAPTLPSPGPKGGKGVAAPRQHRRLDRAAAPPQRLGQG